MTSTLVDDGFHSVFSAAQVGQPAALQAVLDEFGAPVENFLRRRGVADPESTANSVIYRALRSGDAERMTQTAAFRGYVFAIARNEVVTQRRYQARRVVLDLVDDAEELGSWPTQAAPGAELSVLSGLAVEELLSHVSDDQAEVIELRVLEGQTLEATARILGKSVPAVTSLQYRGLARLRKAVSAAVVLVVVVLASRLLGGGAAEAPVISDDTGFVETPSIEPDRFDGSMPALEPDGVLGPHVLGGGTSDAPRFTADSGPSTFIPEPANAPLTVGETAPPPAAAPSVSLPSPAATPVIAAAPKAAAAAENAAPDPVVIPQANAAAEADAVPQVNGVAAAAATMDEEGAGEATVGADDERSPNGKALGIQKSAGCAHAAGKGAKSPATCADSLADHHENR